VPAGLNAGGDFANIRFWHCDIEQDKVRLKVLGCLMSFARVVLFTDEIAASRFQRRACRVGKSRLLSIIKMHAFYTVPRLREKICFDRSVMIPRQIVASPVLTCELTEKTRAQKSSIKRDQGLSMATRRRFG